MRMVQECFFFEPGTVVSGRGIFERLFNCDLCYIMLIQNVTYTRLVTHSSSSSLLSLLSFDDQNTGNSLGTYWGG